MPLPSPKCTAPRFAQFLARAPNKKLSSTRRLRWWAARHRPPTDSPQPPGSCQFTPHDRNRCTGSQSSPAPLDAAAFAMTATNLPRVRTPLPSRSGQLGTHRSSECSSDSGHSQYTGSATLRRAANWKKFSQRALSCEPDNRCSSCRRESDRWGQGMSGETPESAQGPAPTDPPTTVQDPPSGTDGGPPHASGHVHAHHPTIRFRFLEQLKHRNIIRVGILYLVACWLILDPVHVVFHMLEVPAWANRLVVILMAIGFPAVLLFAWVYEITPEGLKPTVEVDPHRSIRKLTGQRLDRAIMVLLVLGVAYLLVDKLWLAKHVAAVESAARVAGEHGTESDAQTLATVAPAPPAASIAVLAFSDLSAEGNQGYFSDGIAEEILSVLAHVNGLKVASRTSSFQFRKSDLGAPAIAQKLGVRHILERSVRKAGDTVRITAQLIDASTDQHEWSQSFDRPLSTANLFAIQDEIAKSIVDHLTAAMGSAADVAGPVARKADTANEDAYDLYLKGRSLFIARTKENLAEAARILKVAVPKDPKFARAWEMLGAVLVTQHHW